MNNEFKNLMEYAKEMHRRYFFALYSFYAYEGLREVIAPNIVGENNAEENVKIIGRYKDFFNPAKEALRIYFFLELAKMFDSSKQSLHINKILNFTKSNFKKFTVESFKEYNKSQPRAFLDELVNEYKKINYSDVEVLKKMLEEYKSVLDKLDTYRDKWLAHDEKNKPELPEITGEEIKKLFDVLAKILNTITGKLNSESWTYSHVERDVKHHTKLVIDHLRRFESYRLQEIEDEYQTKLK